MRQGALQFLLVIDGLASTTGVLGDFHLLGFEVGSQSKGLGHVLFVDGLGMFADCLGPPDGHIGIAILDIITVGGEASVGGGGGGDGDGDGGWV